VVTRELIDTHWLFEDGKKHISYTSTGSLPANDPKTITSVVGLYEIVKELYGPLGRKEFESDRPSDEEIQTFTDNCIEYLNELLKQVSEYKQVFVSQIANASDFRSESANHLLFRPAGQRVFARATKLLIERGKSMKSAIATLRKVDLDLFNPIWQYLLWDPINERMVTNKLLMAETQLLLQAGQTARTKANASKLKEFLKAIKNA
jgi:DNA sulfur modification protein DndB